MTIQMKLEDAQAHPSPDWTPHLDWGDPLPLLWRRAGPGAWEAWPPEAVTTQAPDGPVRWAFDESSYRAERPYAPVVPKAYAPPGYGEDVPFTHWGGPVPAHWFCAKDGTPILSPAEIRVEVGEAELLFSLKPASFLPGKRDPFRFRPTFALVPDLPEIGRGFASWTGSSWTFPVPGHDWIREAKGFPTWLGTLLVEPGGVSFVDARERLPLWLPDEEEIAAEEEEERLVLQSLGNAFHYHRLMCDLARHEALTERLLDGRFAGQLLAILHRRDVVQESSGASVYFPSERSHKGLVADLRRLNEPFMWMDALSGPDEPALQAEVEAALSKAGYRLEDVRR